MGEHEKEWKALAASTPFHGIMSLYDYELVSLWVAELWILFIARYDN